MTDITVLKNAIKLVAHAVNDSVKAAADATLAAKFVDFQNLIPDVLVLLPNIGEIPKEAAHLDPEDYAALLAEIATDLTLPPGKTEEIVKASIKLLSDVALVMVPDVAALIAAAKA